MTDELLLDAIESGAAVGIADVLVRCGFFPVLTETDWPVLDSVDAVERLRRVVLDPDDPRIDDCWVRVYVDADRCECTMYVLDRGHRCAEKFDGTAPTEARARLASLLRAMFHLNAERETAMETRT